MTAMQNCTHALAGATYGKEVEEIDSGCAILSCEFFR